MLELENLVAELAGFDTSVVTLERAGRQGDFRATVTRPTAWLTKADAQREVDKACAKLREKYVLGD